MAKPVWMLAPDGQGDDAYEAFNETMRQVPYGTGSPTHLAYRPDGIAAIWDLPAYCAEHGLPYADDPGFEEFERRMKNGIWPWRRETLFRHFIPDERPADWHYRHLMERLHETSPETDEIIVQGSGTAYLHVIPEIFTRFENLRWLFFRRCYEIRDYSILGRISSLEAFGTMDELSDISCLPELPNLRECCFRLAEGCDLSPLLELPLERLDALSVSSDAPFDAHPGGTPFVAQIKALGGTVSSGQMLYSAKLGERSLFQIGAKPRPIVEGAARKPRNSASD